MRRPVDVARTVDRAAPVGRPVDRSSSQRNLSANRQSVQLVGGGAQVLRGGPAAGGLTSVGGAASRRGLDGTLTDVELLDGGGLVGIAGLAHRGEPGLSAIRARRYVRRGLERPPGQIELLDLRGLVGAFGSAIVLLPWINRVAPRSRADVVVRAAVSTGPWVRSSSSIAGRLVGRVRFRHLIHDSTSTRSGAAGRSDGGDPRGGLDRPVCVRRARRSRAAPRVRTAAFLLQSVFGRRFSVYTGIGRSGAESSRRAARDASRARASPGRGARGAAPRRWRPREAGPGPLPGTHVEPCNRVPGGAVAERIQDERGGAIQGPDSAVFTTPDEVAPRSSAAIRIGAAR